MHSITVPLSDVPSRAQILVSHLADLLKSHFSPLVDGKKLSEMLGKLGDLAEVFGTKGRRYVDQEAFMSLVLDEKRALVDASGEPLETAQVLQQKRREEEERAAQQAALSRRAKPYRYMSPSSRRRAKRAQSEEPSEAKLRGISVPPAIPEEPCWPILNALKLVQKVYQDKIKADATDDAIDNPRQNMQEYMDDWFINQYVDAVRCCGTRLHAVGCNVVRCVLCAGMAWAPCDVTPSPSSLPR